MLQQRSPSCGTYARYLIQDRYCRIPVPESVVIVYGEPVDLFLYSPCIAEQQRLSFKRYLFIDIASCRTGGFPAGLLLQWQERNFSEIFLLLVLSRSSADTGLYYQGDHSDVSLEYVWTQSQNDCVHEQTAKAACEYPLYKDFLLWLLFIIKKACGKYYLFSQAHLFP